MDKSKKELLKRYIALLYRQIAEGEGLQNTPRLKLVDSIENAKLDPIGYTAHYNPTDNSIVLYITNRLIVDVLRSFAHECIHAKQNERGDLKDAHTELGYAQTDPHMREMENEAFLKGSQYLRTLQDTIRIKTKK
jgi:hypothetical protein